MRRVFISKSSAYRILKAAALITAPDYVVIKAAEEFKDKTTAINQMWQTDFTYFKIIGWGWYYLSTILDNYSRYIMEALHDYAGQRCDGYYRIGVGDIGL